MRITRRTIIIAVTGAAVFIGLSVFLYLYPPTHDYLTSETLLRESVQRFGVFAPLVAVLYHILQVVVAPIPGQPIDIATGYLFGPYLGIAVGLIGVYLGSALGIILARRFGRPLVEHLIPQDQVRVVDRFLLKRSTWFYVVLFLLPVSPGDLLCYALGLSKIPVWRALLIIILGRTPVVITAVLIGVSGKQFSPLEFIGIAAVVIALVLVVARFVPLKRIQEFHFWST